MKNRIAYTFTEILVISFKILIFPIWFPFFYIREKWLLYRFSRRQFLRKLEWQARDAAEKIRLYEIQEAESRWSREMFKKRLGYYKVIGRCDKWWRIASGTIEAESIADAMRKAKVAIQEQIDTGDVFNISPREIRFVEPLTDSTVCREEKFRCIEAPTD